MHSSDIRKGKVAIKVKAVQVEGSGAILLTGPSSCGKGEVAKALQHILNIPKERHLSMGNILRMTIDKAHKDDEFREQLARDYGISYKVSIYDEKVNNSENVSKARRYDPQLRTHFMKLDFSQLEWLEFCVNNGLLVPDEWTVKIIDAIFKSSKSLQENLFILDGYPRTNIAAEKLMDTFKGLEIPVIKVIHLSITKEEMKKRAFGRKRMDDDEESLERRYSFYIEKVHPSVDYLKLRLGSERVVLVDAHQPVYMENDELNVKASINKVAFKVIRAMGLPHYLMDLKETEEGGLYE